MKPTYINFRSILKNIVEDLRVLDGSLPSTGGSWQDVAGTLATNMEVYAGLLHRARAGDHEPMLVFPSIDEIVEGKTRVLGAT